MDKKTVPLTIHIGGIRHVIGEADVTVDERGVSSALITTINDENIARGIIRPVIRGLSVGFKPQGA